MCLSFALWDFPTLLELLLSQVVTVKRLCVKKLPPILAIQLKRFEYDYERVCPIKFNDYFEFPRDLDMEPYTGWYSSYCFLLYFCYFFLSYGEH